MNKPIAFETVSMLLLVRLHVPPLVADETFACHAHVAYITQIATQNVARCGRWQPQPMSAVVLPPDEVAD